VRSVAESGVVADAGVVAVRSFDESNAAPLSGGAEVLESVFGAAMRDTVGGNLVVSLNSNADISFVVGKESEVLEAVLVVHGVDVLVASGGGHAELVGVVSGVLSEAGAGVGAGFGLGVVAGVSVDDAAEVLERVLADAGVVAVRSFDESNAAPLSGGAEVLVSDRAAAVLDTVGIFLNIIVDIKVISEIVAIQIPSEVLETVLVVVGVNVLVASGGGHAELVGVVGGVLSEAGVGVGASVSLGVVAFVSVDDAASVGGGEEEGGGEFHLFFLLILIKN